ncbi:MAG: hypothetical protein MZU97_09885 [Bacillus subtilis]|nr:hypothetical protein [Bacillus subtilis]
MANCKRLLHEIETEYPDVNFGEIIKDQCQHSTRFPVRHYYTGLLENGRSGDRMAPFGIADPYANDNPCVKFSILTTSDRMSSTKLLPSMNTRFFVISELDKEYNSHYNKSRRRN